jgi:hypothetical protein
VKSLALSVIRSLAHRRNPVFADPPRSGTREEREVPRGIEHEHDQRRVEGSTLAIDDVRIATPQFDVANYLRTRC